MTAEIKQKLPQPRFWFPVPKKKERKGYIQSKYKLATNTGAPYLPLHTGAVRSTKHSPNQTHLPITDTYFIIKKVI